MIIYNFSRVFSSCALSAAIFDITNTDWFNGVPFELMRIKLRNFINIKRVL